MRKLLSSVAAVLLTLIAAGPAAAKVINVEFKFTPYTGDPAKSDQVVSVAGNARVFVNNIPVAEQPVEKRELPVLFEVGSSRVDLQACKLEYSIVSPK